MSTTTLDERRELAEVVRAFLAKRSPLESVRQTMESPSEAPLAGYDMGLWRAMADEIGLQGLAVPEEHGGSGAGWVELAAVMEELGRALACVPFLSTIGLGVSTLLASQDASAQTAWLPRIATGEVIATAAITGDIAVTATESGGTWRLSGTAGHVLDAGIADLVLVLADTAEGPTLFAVAPPAASGVMDLESVRTSDLTRRMWRVSFADVSAEVVGSVGDGSAVATTALWRARAALAAEQVGVASAALEMAVDYAKTRRQFGRAIGSFQAVKHKLADLLVSTETARSASWAAARAIESGDDVELITHIAALVCSESANAAASGNVQVHGGIGFTWEHSAHLFVKRSRGSAVLFGTPRDYRARLSTLVPVLSGQPNPGAADA